MFRSSRFRVAVSAMTVMLIVSIALAVAVFALPRSTMAQAICYPDPATNPNPRCIYDPGCAVQYSWSERQYCFDAIHGQWYQEYRLFCNCPSR